MSNSKRYVFLLFIVFGLISHSIAQIKGPDFQWKHISNRLSHNRVHSILEDHQGFLWIGTHSGLNRYDGQNFRIFEHNKEEERSLPGNEIHTLFEDAKGELWVGTDNGLARFNRSDEKFDLWIPDQAQPTDFINADVKTIIEFGNGELWVGTGIGIFSVDESRYFMKKINFETSAQFHVQALLEDNSGKIWIGTSEDLYFAEANSRNIQSPSMRNGEKINATIIDIIQGKNKRIWVSTESKGVFELFGNNDIYEYRKFDNTPGGTHNLGSMRVNSMAEDANGQIWLAPENQGLVVYNPHSDRLTKYKSNRFNEASISTNSIWDIYHDVTGRIWLGTFNKGISLMDPKDRKFSHVRQNFFSGDGISNDAVTSFLEVGNEVWVGTDGGGINVWNQNRDKFRYFQKDHNQPQSLGSDAVLDMYEDSNGTIWIATWEGGLNKYEGKGSFKRFMNQPNNSNSIPSNMIFAIDEDRNKNLWIALWNRGIARYNPNDDSFFTINKSTHGNDLWHSDFTNDILVDQSNTLWVGTEIGLNRITFQTDEDFSVTTFLNDPNDPTSISSNYVNKVFEDHSGKLWICTSMGLNLYHEGSNNFERINKSSGLSGNFAQSIIQDTDNNYWVTTNKGISKITKIGSGWQLQNYDATDGIQGDNFSRGASYLTKDNTLLLGGTNGFNHFKQEMVKDNPHAPVVHFSKLKIFNKEVIDYGDNAPLASHINTATALTLQHHQNVFSIEYVGVSMTHADKNQYAFRLLGLETEWNDVGAQTTASYSNLEAGDYTFEVKAANNDGLWSSTPRELTITVLPPWWNTWWFKSFGSLFALLAIGSAVYVRSKQTRRYEKQLKEKIAEAVNDANRQKEEIATQKDRLQLAVAETNQVVNATINSGNFHERMILEGKEGEWRELAQSINNLFKSILKPFNELNEIINSIAQGDLTPRLENEFKGDTAAVAQNLNLALDKLSGFIREISTSIISIQQVSMEMKDATDDLHIVSGEITSAIGEMSTGAQQQLQRVGQSFQLTEEILKFSDQMGQLAKSINQSANLGSEKSIEGKAMVAAQNNIMNEIGSISKESNASMQHLEKRSKEISGIISIMKEIATQTNMLSLNAAIEAAQAGDAGRGFAVVATEIRKLAVDSKKSAGMIEDLITSIQSETEAMARLMQKMDHRVNDGITASGETDKALAVITELYKETVISSQKITEATGQQVQDIRGISGILEEVVVISEQTASGTEEIHASAERVSLQMNAFKDRSNHNMEIAKDLSQKSSNFKLDTEERIPQNLIL